RSVTLIRTSSRRSSDGAVWGSVRSTPWNASRAGPPNTNRSPLRSSTSVHGCVRVSLLPNLNTLFAQADRHDRAAFGDGTFSFADVLVQTQLRGRRVDVDDRCVEVQSTGLEARIRGGAHCELRDIVGERLHRRAVMVVTSSGVRVRIPMPAQAHGTDR